VRQRESAGDPPAILSQNSHSQATTICANSEPSSCKGQAGVGEALLLSFFFLSSLLSSETCYRERHAPRYKREMVVHEGPASVPVCRLKCRASAFFHRGSYRPPGAEPSCSKQIVMLSAKSQKAAHFSSETHVVTAFAQREYRWNAALTGARMSS
jgi:hypothetical protein